MMEEGGDQDFAGINESRTAVSARHHHAQPSVESPRPSKRHKQPEIAATEATEFKDHQENLTLPVDVRYEPGENAATTATAGNEEIHQELLTVPEDVRYIIDLNVERCPNINRSQLFSRLTEYIIENKLVFYSEKTSSLSEEDKTFFIDSIQKYKIDKKEAFAIIIDSNSNEYFIGPVSLEKNKNQSNHTKNEKHIHKEIKLLNLINKDIGCKNNIVKVFMLTPDSCCPHRKEGGSCMRDIYNYTKEWNNRGIITICAFNAYYGINGTTDKFWNTFLKGPLDEILENNLTPDKNNIWHVTLKEFLSVLEGSLPVHKPLKISKIKKIQLKQLKLKNMKIHFKEKVFLGQMEQRLNQESHDSLYKYYEMVDSKSEFYLFWIKCCKELYREHCKEIFCEKFNKIILEYTLEQNTRTYLQFGFL